MSSIKKLWAIEYSNGSLMVGEAGIELFSTKFDAQYVIDAAKIKAKPARVLVTVSKVV